MSEEKKENLHEIIKYTDTAKEYMKNVCQVYPSKDKKPLDFDMSILDQFDDIFASQDNPDYKKLSKRFAKTINDNKIQYNDDGSVKMVYSCIIENIDLYDSQYKSFYLRYKKHYDNNPALFKSGFVKSRFDSRSTGQSFGNYINSLSQSVDLEDLEDCNDVCITTGGNSDKRLKDYCNSKFGLSLSKGVDAIGKGKSGKYYIFEAKLLTVPGGSQNHQLNNALNVSKINNDSCHGVAVLDGTFVTHKNYPKINAVFSNSNNNEYDTNYIISATEIIHFLCNN